MLHTNASQGQNAYTRYSSHYSRRHLSIRYQSILFYQNIVRISSRCIIASIRRVCKHTMMLITCLVPSLKFCVSNIRLWHRHDVAAGDLLISTKTSQRTVAKWGKVQSEQGSNCGASFAEDYLSCIARQAKRYSKRPYSRALHSVTQSIPNNLFRLHWTFLFFRMTQE